MNPEEVEVYVTRDGLLRAAIVRRTDGFFCIYIFQPITYGGWFEFDGQTSLLYESQDPEFEVKPEVGIYGTVDDARREILSLEGFSDAILQKKE
jgi:hypothetical protein